MTQEQMKIMVELCVSARKIVEIRNQMASLVITAMLCDYEGNSEVKLEAERWLFEYGMDQADRMEFDS